MDAANYSSLIVEDMITYADYFFPGEIDFERDLESMIMELNDVDSSSGSSLGMRRCMSNSSLNDLGDSPTHGSPKPITRRKNKPAPTPPSGTTPDKQQKQQQQIPQYEHKRPDDKPPLAPDKPPRPLTTATLNRATYKSMKHDQVTTELIQLQASNNQVPSSIVHDKPTFNSKSLDDDSKSPSHSKNEFVKVTIFLLNLLKSLTIFFVD